MDFKKTLQVTVINLVVEEAVGYLIRQFSFLKFGPLTWITEKLVRKVVEALYTQGRLIINDMVIDYHLSKETEALKDARVRAQQAHKDGNENAIKDADEQIKAAARDLIRFGRSPL